MADLKQLEQLYAKYGPYYSGKLILEASQLYKAGKFTEAAQKFADSRDGFEKKKNPTEWKILDDWREQAELKVNKSKTVALQMHNPDEMGRTFDEDEVENSEEYLGDEGTEEGGEEPKEKIKSVVATIMRVVKHMPDAACPECGSTADDLHIGRGTHKCAKCGNEYIPHEMVKAGTSAGSRKGHEAKGHKASGSLSERSSGIKLAKKKLASAKQSYIAANNALESAKAKGTSGDELKTLFNTAKSAWEVYADAGKLLSEVKYSKSGVAEAKHLPGKHDQSTHAGGKGAASKVAHTPSQLGHASARQMAKDEGISQAEARKKLKKKVSTKRRKKPGYFWSDRKWRLEWNPSVNAPSGSSIDQYGRIKSLIEKRIVKRGSKYCVVSEDGSKNLGCSDSKEGAQKRLQQVEFFKHKKSYGSDEVFIAKALDFGVLETDDIELKSFTTKQKLERVKSIVAGV